MQCKSQSPLRYLITFDELVSMLYVGSQVACGYIGSVGKDLPPLSGSIYALVPSSSWKGNQGSECPSMVPPAITLHNIVSVEYEIMSCRVDDLQLMSVS